MQIHPFQASFPDMGLISSADHFFSSVKERYNDYVASGFYDTISQDAMFICRITGRGRTYTGLIACVDIKEYLEGRVKRHEKTLASSEQEQIQGLMKRGAQVKPVMLAYRPEEAIETILQKFIAENEPFIEAVFETLNEVHHFWEIKDSSVIAALQELFAEHVPVSYISDGHHRTSSSALMYKRFGENNSENLYRWLPCSLFPISEIEIYDYNRIIEGMNNVSPASFMAQLSQIFEIELLAYAQKPRKKHELTLFLENEWYRLTWRQEVLKAYENEPVILDVNLFNEKVLKEILDIVDVRTDLRVKYVNGGKTMAKLKEKTLNGEERFAFCLYPVSIEDFLAVSDAGGVLPPKSTWVEPKVRSGFLVRNVENS